MAYGQAFKIDKEWIKHDVADILRGPDKEFLDLLDLETEMGDQERIKGLEELFSTNISGLTNMLLSRAGIVELHKAGKIFLLPAVKTELGVLN